MAREYNVISGDGHIDLNPDAWRDRVAAKWRDRAPKRVAMPNGMDAIQVDGGHPHTIGLTRNVGYEKTDDLAVKVPTFDNGFGGGPPEQRLREQDEDGLDAEVLFSQLTPLLRDAKDDDLFLDLVRAYNEFLGEEYQAADPDRLIPMGLLPTTGVDDAIREMEHCAAVGLRGVKLDAYPTPACRTPRPRTTASGPPPSPCACRSPATATDVSASNVAGRRSSTRRSRAQTRCTRRTRSPTSSASPATR